MATTGTDCGFPVKQLATTKERLRQVKWLKAYFLVIRRGERKGFLLHFLLLFEDEMSFSLN